MLEKSILAVLIGIFGALFGVYFKEMIKEASQRRKIANRLIGYLNDSYRELFENPIMRDLLISAETLNEKESLAQDINEYKKIKAKHLQIFDSLKDKLKKDDKTLDNVITRIKDLHIVERNFQKNILDDSIIDLKENRNFISDEDASILSWKIATRVIEIRTRVNYMLRNYKLLIILCEAVDYPDKEKVADCLYNIVINLLFITKNMSPLLEYAHKICKKNILFLIFSE